LVRQFLLSFNKISVADLHHFDADPDPDPAFHFNADPDPTLQIKAQNFEKMLK